MEEKAIEISKEVARHYVVSRQGFLRRRGKQGTLEAIEQLECVQVDPINVVHPNQHLVLHNRVTDYRSAYLEELLYKDRRIFEYWCNEKSIIPIKDYRHFRYRMQNPTEFHSPFYERIKAQRKELQREISYILSEIEKHGPLSAREFEQRGRMKGNIATRVLNLLWDCGDLMIHHVEENKRCYDLTEHLLPPLLSTAAPPKEEFVQFMICKYMRAYGLVDTRDWRFGWLPLKGSERKTVVERMVRDNKLIPIKVEGIKHVYYVLEEYSPLLEESNASANEETLFIAPLDNLLWNRRIISEIFDFDYAWEVYKVPEKRIYGYYVMPILHGTRFIGRLDPKLDRQNKKMIINSLLLEEKAFDKGICSKLAASLQRFTGFHEVSQVSIEKTQPKELRAALMQELRAF